MPNVDILRNLYRWPFPRRQETIGECSCSDRFLDLDRREECTKLWGIHKQKQRVESFDDDLDEEDASKQGRESDKTKSMFQDSDFDVLNDDMEDVEGENSFYSYHLECACSALHLLLLVSITTLQPLPTIDPKDKGKGVLVEEESKKPKKVKKKGSRQEEATSAALVEEFDEIQDKINADHELAKQLAAERAEAIRNKPPTRTQVRNRVIKHLCRVSGSSSLSFGKKVGFDDFKPIDDDNQQQAESTKKRPKADSEEESSKKQKLEEDNDAEKEELRDSMIAFPRDDVAIDVESLATKYPIVNWKIHILNENMMYYQINRADGSSKNYKIFSEMLDDLTDKM
ncbi:hypothetical protein Tco_0727646 [Tanacetum coccineum]|uniref:Uncharacterized protein n=1 Tax=Tanacetum coccineum TaxID=301880 RepID=A0ABQ4YJV5_9ASTR